MGPLPPDGGGSFVVFVPVLGVGVAGEPVAGLVVVVVDIAELLGLDRYCVCPWPDPDAGTDERCSMN